MVDTIILGTELEILEVRLMELYDVSGVLFISLVGVQMCVCVCECICVLCVSCVLNGGYPICLCVCVCVCICVCVSVLCVSLCGDRRPQHMSFCEAKKKMVFCKRPALSRLQREAVAVLFL